MQAKEQKKEIIQQFQVHQNDTGSAEVQIAILSSRISYLTDHFKTHKKDHHSRRGLIRLVSQRRKMLDYLKRKNFDGYQQIIAKLGIRK
jgi:small subunit ribosomal protein S15